MFNDGFRRIIRCFLMCRHLSGFNFSFEILIFDDILNLIKKSRFYNEKLNPERCLHIRKQQIKGQSLSEIMWEERLAHFPCVYMLLSSRNDFKFIRIWIVGLNVGHPVQGGPARMFPGKRKVREEMGTNGAGNPPKQLAPTLQKSPQKFFWKIFF